MPPPSPSPAADITAARRFFRLTCGKPGPHGSLPRELRRIMWEFRAISIPKGLSGADEIALDRLKSF
ncbi:MAG: hypothetical protein U1D06_12495 [Paracoccaceae bacterium]|nr:hypothetical protein [Paracoccaceae bacterium]